MSSMSSGSLLGCTKTYNKVSMSRAASAILPSEAEPYPQASAVSRVEKSLVWGLAGLQHEAEPVQVGCLCLSLQG